MGDLEPYLLTETENRIIDDILALLNKNGVTSHQSLNLLERLDRIIDMGQRLAKRTTHYGRKVSLNSRTDHAISSEC